MIKLSVVIPVHNGEAFIENTIMRFLETNNISLQIIVVNDCSTDRTRTILQRLSKKHKCIETIHLKENIGAGNARNLGFKNAKGEYVLFFDADDIIHLPALESIIKYADETNVDCVVAAYNILPAYGEEPRRMHNYDHKTWQNLLEGEERKILEEGKTGHICATTNYPWNKVIRTEFAKNIEIKFGDTPVHNDILGSWCATALANKLALTAEIICTYRAASNENNITNISDARRMKIFDALASVENLLNEHPAVRYRLYHHFINFSLICVMWAKDRIPHECREEFGILASETFSNSSFSEYLELKKHMPNVAKKVEQIRFCPTGVFK